MKIRHPFFRRLQWHPLLVALPFTYLGYVAYIKGFPLGPTAAALFVAVWFGLSVFDAISGHRWLDFLYSEDDQVKGEQVDNDASLFRKTLAAPNGKPSAKLLAFLRERDVSEKAIEYLKGYILKRSSGVSAIDFYSQDGWIGANDEEFVPIAIRDGLLIVGSCPNGDPVAVDVREQLGAAGYIDHETMWQASSVREVFAVLAPGLGALAAGLAADAIPLDYYEATQKG